MRTFDILPLHYNKRVSCTSTVSGYVRSLSRALDAYSHVFLLLLKLHKWNNDDVRLLFSVLDPIFGDVFSVLWEPEMIRETGSALEILTREDRQMKLNRLRHFEKEKLALEEKKKDAEDYLRLKNDLIGALSRQYQWYLWKGFTAEEKLNTKKVSSCFRHTSYCHNDMYL